ncbi:MAG: hypothetical protein R3A52_32755 [Polyangiales bacterium]
MRTLLLSVLALTAACLDARPPPARPTALSLDEVRVDAPADDLLPRAPRFTLRFDRPVALTGSDDLYLLTGEVTDALRTDAYYGTLSATNAARRVPVTLAVDPDDPTRVTLTARVPLLPETALAVLVPPRVRDLDGDPLSFGDAGTRAAAFAYAVSPARRCGPLPTLASSPRVPPAVRAMYVSLDRPSLGEPVARLDLPRRRRRRRRDPLVPRPRRRPLRARRAPRAPRPRRDVHPHPLGPALPRGITRGGPLAHAQHRRSGLLAAAHRARVRRGETRIDPLCVRATARGVEVRAASTGEGVVVLDARPRRSDARRGLPLGDGAQRAGAHARRVGRVVDFRRAPRRRRDAARPHRGGAVARAGALARGADRRGGGAAPERQRAGVRRAGERHRRRGLARGLGARVGHVAVGASPTTR